MLEFLVLLKRPTFSHKLEHWYIWICTKEKMGNRSAYPWIQRIPAKPQFWCDANVSSFTPNTLSGVFKTSCSLKRWIQDSYGFVICWPYNAGPPAWPLVPSPCPCHSSLSPCVLFYNTIAVLSLLPSSTLSLFNIQRSGLSLPWAPQPNVPITTQCPQHRLPPPSFCTGSRQHVQWWVRDLVCHLRGSWAGWPSSLPCSVGPSGWGMRAPCLPIIRGSSSKSLSLS